MLVLDIVKGKTDYNVLLSTEEVELLISLLGWHINGNGGAKDACSKLYVQLADMYEGNIDNLGPFDTVINHSMVVMR